jgi:hypothetical protein
MMGRLSALGMALLLAAAGAETGRKLIERSLSRAAAGLVSSAEVEAIRGRIVAVAMLFFGRLALGRYAGYGSWKVGLMMVGPGNGLVLAIIALGG